MVVEEVPQDGLLCGANLVQAAHRAAVRRLLRTSGDSAASRTIASMASTNPSSRSFGSVSVGSTISASGTTSGKYTVGGWIP